MIPKRERFSTENHSLIKNLKSRKIHTNIGFFLVLEGEKKGIIMSKKKFKRAVDRNKYKRLFYNSILDYNKKPNNENNNLKNISFIFHPKAIFTKEDLLENFKTLKQI